MKKVPYFSNYYIMQRYYKLVCNNRHCYFEQKELQQSPEIITSTEDCEGEIAIASQISSQDGKHVFKCLQ